jgi:hypothetical protein
MKLIILLMISLFIISCNKSNEKRYLYFKTETSTKEFYLEGAKRKTFFKKRKPDIVLKITDFQNYEKDWLEAFYTIEVYNGILIKAKLNNETIFGGKIEFLDEDEYLIKLNEGVFMPTVVPTYYNETHEYTENIHTIPITNQCWLELADGKGIIKIVWAGKSYVL